jgi:alcohol dehydrogenase class IV
LPCTLEQAGIRADELEPLVAESFHPNILNNPRRVTPVDLRRIYLAMQGG